MKIELESGATIDVWSPETVKNFIVACRKDKGIPMFRTRIFGKRIENAVIGVCYGGEDRVPSKIFVNPPEKDVEFLEEGVGDWRRLLEKWNFIKELEECKREGILLKGYKLPLITAD